MTQTPANILRQNTQDLHRVLDNSPLMRSLIKGQFSLEQYTTCLKGMLTSYTHLDQALLEFETHWPGKLVPPYTPRSEWILQELRQLNSGPIDTPEMDSVTVKIEDEAGYWGCRYVLDGSGLGAVYLLPRLQSRFDGLGYNSELHFWVKLSKLSSNWAELLDRVNHQLIEPGSVCHAVDQARIVFQVFITNIVLEKSQTRLKKSALHAS